MIIVFSTMENIDNRSNSQRTTLVSLPVSVSYTFIFMDSHCTYFIELFLCFLGKTKYGYFLREKNKSGS